MDVVRGEVARLRRVTIRVGALEEDNDSLKATINKMKHEVSRAHKNMKDSGVQELRNERDAANAKLAEVQMAMHHLREQLKQAESHNTTLSKASPAPRSPELEGIDLKKFGLSSQAYTKESARLLDYLDKLQNLVLTRAQGITDRNSNGWSAYERLEGLIAAARTRSSEATQLVMDLDLDAAKEVRLDTQGFPILNVKRGGARK